MLKKLIVILTAAILLLTGCENVYTKKPDNTESESKSSSSTTTTTTTTDSKSTTTISTTTPKPTTTTTTTTSTTTAVKLSNVATKPSYTPNNKWYLTLVNYQYGLPANFTVKTNYIASGVLVDERIVNDYNKMHTAALKDGVKLNPCSGYRSIALQTKLFTRRVNQYMSYGYSKKDAEKIVATYTARPGTSEHNLGLAIDFYDSSTDLTSSFASTTQGKWLKENAHKYGFILRYPSDKTAITGIIYEPWHYRYVGIEDAIKIHNSGLCFEEYLGLAGKVDVDISDVTKTSTKKTTTTTRKITTTTKKTTTPSKTTKTTTTSLKTTTTTTTKPTSTSKSTTTSNSTTTTKKQSTTTTKKSMATTTTTEALPDESGN